jgi:hypothetical protein
MSNISIRPGSTQACGRVSGPLVAGLVPKATTARRSTGLINPAGSATSPGALPAGVVQLSPVC